MRRTSYDSAPNTGEKQLANHPMRVKRIEIIKPTKSVPKKKRTIQAEIAGGAPPEAGGSPAEMKIKKAPTVRRTPAPKSATARKKSATAAKTKVSMSPGAGQRAEPADETIRLRAYFISERRRRFGLPGDAESDWLEARRQLLSETRR